jgi:prophage antirepressor-like protein
MIVTSIQPFTYQGKEIGASSIHAEPWFVAKDICKVLALSNPSHTMARLDADEKLLSQIVIAGQRRDVLMVNESGLYHLIFSSTKPEAKAFRKWVTAEVLPALRQRGVYEVGADRNLPKAAPVLPTRQGTLFPVESTDRIRARSLMLDVALQAKPGSKVAQLVRLIKPMVMEGHSL